MEVVVIVVVVVNAQRHAREKSLLVEHSVLLHIHICEIYDHKLNQIK